MSKVELVDYTQNAVQKIGRYAAICYDGKTDVESNKKRAAHCVNKGHLSTLRFAHAVFRVELSRVCLAQFTRSKHLDYLVRSSRYCNESDADIFVPKSITESFTLENEYKNHCRRSKDLYDTLIHYGIKKEDARFVLPQSQMTELFVVGNFQAWLDFINLRTTKAAQGEIRDIALEIKRQLSEIAPEIFT